MRTVSFSLALPRKCTDVPYERIDLSIGRPAVERGHVAFSVGDDLLQIRGCLGLDCLRTQVRRIQTFPNRSGSTILPMTRRAIAVEQAPSGAILWRCYGRCCLKHNQERHECNTVVEQILLLLSFLGYWLSN